jgi:hypothetical protein
LLDMPLGGVPDGQVISKLQVIWFNGEYHQMLGTRTLCDASVPALEFVGTSSVVKTHDDLCSS